MPKTIFTGAHTLLVETLRTARKDAGLTQAELAARIGRDQSYISLIEGSQRRVDTLEFVVLCRAMAADPVALFEKLVTSLPRDIQV